MLRGGVRSARDASTVAMAELMTTMETVTMAGLAVLVMVRGR